MIPYSQLQLQDKATILTTERKKVFLLLLVLCWWSFFTLSSIPSLVPCIYSSLFKCLFFSRGEKLFQRTWLELRILANITKWPHMWWVSIFLSLHLSTYFCTIFFYWAIIITCTRVFFRVFIVQVFLVFWLWICVHQTPAKFSLVHCFYSGVDLWNWCF